MKKKYTYDVEYMFLNSDNSIEKRLNHWGDDKIKFLPDIGDQILFKVYIDNDVPDERKINILNNHIELYDIFKTFHFEVVSRKLINIISYECENHYKAYRYCLYLKPTYLHKELDEKILESYF